jgi:hypothetical protein
MVIGGGNQIQVFNSIEMFLTITFVTRMNVQTLKSQGVDKKLDPQGGRHNDRFSYHNHLCWEIQIPALRIIQLPILH